MDYKLYYKLIKRSSFRNPSFVRNAAVKLHSVLKPYVFPMGVIGIGGIVYPMIPASYKAFSDIYKNEVEHYNRRKKKSLNIIDDIDTYEPFEDTLL